MTKPNAMHVVIAASIAVAALALYVGVKHERRVARERVKACVDAAQAVYVVTMEATIADVKNSLAQTKSESESKLSYNDDDDELTSALKRAVKDVIVGRKAGDLQEKLNAARTEASAQLARATKACNPAP